MTGRRLFIYACLLALAAPAWAQEAKPAQPDVAAANRTVLSQLPFGDRQDFDDAMRGFIATVPANPDPYAFLKGEAPATVNPSLWREAQLDAINGLFQVTDGVYQVRGLSVAAMTIVEGKTGVIVIDTLASPGEARTALDLYFAHRPQRPVVAVIYSHNHGDHWGGASAVISPADAASGKVKVIAPVNFMPALIQEASTANNLAGARGQFQFGGGLPVGARGTVEYGEGLAITRGAAGAGPVIPPNDIITKDFESRTIDGVTFEFQLALDTEAPSEMFVYLPGSHVLDVSEVATHTLHNLLPIRGALVRNGLSWSQALTRALEHYGQDAQILITQHQWPVWGNDRVRQSLENHRDLYKYIHDQSLRMMNEGMSPAEISAALTMPPGLEKDWSLRGYYGTLSQDARAVYQRYLGWYDGNPAHLDPLPPEEEAKKTIEYMGGPDATIARARKDFDKGDYRWVVQVMDRIVFADPSNYQARRLGADAYEQMAYMAEAAPWRNSYLLAAQKLRAPPPVASGPPAVIVTAAVAPNVLHAMTAREMFDYVGTRMAGQRAGSGKIVINWRFGDTNEAVVTTLSHGALSVGEKSDPQAITATTSRDTLERVILGDKTPFDALKDGSVKIAGDAQPFIDFWRPVVGFKTAIPLVEPR